jgi:hypothetical protein
MKKYCEALSKSKDSNVLKNILAKVYHKINGVIKLSDLEAEIKEYTEPDEISFSDLQHIMNVLDGNNDGFVSKDRYKVLVDRYDTTRRSLQGNKEIVKAVIRACSNKRTTLKRCFSK